MHYYNEEDFASAKSAKHALICLKNLWLGIKPVRKKAHFQNAKKP